MTFHYYPVRTLKISNSLFWRQNRNAEKRICFVTISGHPQSVHQENCRDPVSTWHLPGSPRAKSAHLVCLTTCLPLYTVVSVSRDFEMTRGWYLCPPWQCLHLLRREWTRVLFRDIGLMAIGSCHFCLPSSSTSRVPLMSVEQARSLLSVVLSSTRGLVAFSGGGVMS